MTGPGGCSVVSGFFVLTRCRRSATQGCAQCGRPLCSLHASVSGLCPMCGAGAAYPSGVFGDDWLETYRRWFYQESGRVYQDQNWYSSIDAYDRLPFDQGSDHDHDYGGEDQRDLVDS
jgi:hypothetical protein